MSHNDTEATKNTSCVKDEGAVDHSTVIRWFNKFCSGYKKLNDQVRSSRPKDEDSKAMLQAIMTNLASSTPRVPDEFDISVQCGLSPS